MKSNFGIKNNCKVSNSKIKITIMFRNKSQSFVFFVLFAFCGQALAMPFIACCLEMDDTRPESAESHSHMMSMHGDHHQTGYQPAMVNPATDHHGSEVSNDHGLENCHHHCDMCLGSATTPVIENIVAVPKGSLASNSIYSFSLPSSRKENPFRPPITA